MKIRDAAPGYSSFLQPQHRLLFRAALLDNDAAVAAFNEWNANTDWSADFDAGSFQLLPQLYTNLERIGYDGPVMGRLRGLYRNTWYRNQQPLALLQKLVKQLELNDIQTTLLGDAALISGYGIGPGARKAHPLEIQIAAQDAAAACSIMADEQWHGAADSSGDLLYRKHASFSRDGNHRCTLYWQTPRDASVDHGSSREGAKPARFNGIDTLIPDAPEMLLHLVQHGLIEHGKVTLPGLAGVATVMKSAEVDWSAVLHLAAENFLQFKLYIALTTLEAELGTPVPNATLSELGEKKVTLAEKLEVRAGGRRADAKDTFFGPLERLSLEYLHYTGETGSKVMLSELPGFLRYHYGADSLPRIFGNVAINGIRRSGRAITRLLQRDKSWLVI